MTDTRIAFDNQDFTMTPDQRTVALIADFPAVQNISSLVRAISRAISAAIEAEREACACIAEDLQEPDSANKSTHSTVEHAGRFAKDAVATDIARRIRERG
jgi:hypothetical protein